MLQSTPWSVIGIIGSADTDFSDWWSVIGTKNLIGASLVKNVSHCWCHEWGERWSLSSAWWTQTLNTLPGINKCVPLDFISKVCLQCICKSDTLIISYHHLVHALLRYSTNWMYFCLFIAQPQSLNLDRESTISQLNFDKRVWCRRVNLRHGPGSGPTQCRVPQKLGLLWTQHNGSYGNIRRCDKQTR